MYYSAFMKLIITTTLKYPSQVETILCNISCSQKLRQRIARICHPEEYT